MATTWLYEYLIADQHCLLVPLFNLKQYAAVIWICIRQIDEFWNFTFLREAKELPSKIKKKKWILAQKKNEQKSFISAT